MAEEGQSRRSGQGGSAETDSKPESEREIEEPRSGTVEDWFGQNVARDQEVADDVAEEHGETDRGEQAFRRRARGRQRYEAGHPRPAEGRGASPDGDGPVGDPDPTRTRHSPDSYSHHRPGVGDPGATRSPGEGWEDRLDPQAEPDWVRFLQGSFMGRPLHTVLNDLPIGFWTSAWFLDLFGGRRSRGAADKLIALGVLSAVPAAVSGLAERQELEGDRRELATLHMGVNMAATSLHGVSWILRRRGARGLGVAVSQIGAVVATVGADIGGRLAFGSASDRHDAPPDGAGPPTGPVAQR